MKAHYRRLLIEVKKVIHQETADARAQNNPLDEETVGDIACDQSPCTDGPIR